MLRFAAVQLMLAQANGGGGGGGQGGQTGSFLDSLVGLAPILIIIVVLFWFMNRSQRKKQEQREEMLDNVQTGDRVVSIGGIHGRVVKVADDTFEVVVDEDNDVRMKFTRNGISRRLDAEEDQD